VGITSDQRLGVGKCLFILLVVLAQHSCKNEPRVD